MDHTQLSMFGEDNKPKPRRHKKEKQPKKDSSTVELEEVEQVLHISNLKNVKMQINSANDIIAFDDNRCHVLENGFNDKTFIVDRIKKAEARGIIDNYDLYVIDVRSGQGSYVCRLLDKRLDVIIQKDYDVEKHADNYLRDGLIALSTITSMETNIEYCCIQRCNLLTVMSAYFEKLFKKGCTFSTELKDNYFSVAKNIIFNNVHYAREVSDDDNIDDPNTNIIGISLLTGEPICAMEFNIYLNRHRLYYTRKIYDAENGDSETITIKTIIKQKKDKNGKN